MEASRDKFRNKYRIESNRNRNHDYGGNGSYFITICTKNRKKYFGEIQNKEMRLSEIGIKAQQFLIEIPKHFNNAELEEFIIMPDHIHIILTVQTLHCNVSTSNVSTSNASTSNASTSNASANKDITTIHTNYNYYNPLNDYNSHLPPGFFKSITPKKGSISTIIRSYKSICTREINRKFPKLNFDWQANYHDRIIRNKQEFQNIKNYIINNPKNWKE